MWSFALCITELVEEEEKESGREESVSRLSTGRDEEDLKEGIAGRVLVVFTEAKAWFGRGPRSAVVRNGEPKEGVFWKDITKSCSFVFIGSCKEHL